jgi:VanZ family protein
MKKFIWRWFPAILVMGLIFIASATPGPKMPGFGYWDVFVKKGGHMTGYALLAASFIHALSKDKRASGFQFTAAICITALYAISDEFHQSFIPGRTSSARDVCIDLAGALIGIALWKWIRTHWSAQRSIDVK